VNWLWFLWFTDASNADVADMKAECVNVEDRITNLGHSSFEITHHNDKNPKVVSASIEVLNRGLKVA
jgi:hypothetical protein